MKVERTLGEPRVSSFKKCIFKFTKKAVTKGYDQLVKNLRTPFDPKSYFGNEEQKKSTFHFYANFASCKDTSRELASSRRSTFA